MTAPTGPSRTSRRQSTKGKTARREARVAYSRTHGTPGHHPKQRRTVVVGSPLEFCGICLAPGDHDGRPHSVAMGDDMTRTTKFNSMTRDDLRAFASIVGLPGRGSMTRNELVAALIAR